MPTAKTSPLKKSPKTSPKKSPKPSLKKSPKKSAPAAKKPTKKPVAKQPVPAKSVTKPVASAKPAKASGPSTLADRLASVAVPADAWALSRVEPGVSVSPHIDQLLAIGWPNMISVVDEPWQPVPAKKALKSFDLHRIVPREMLPRLFAYHHEYDPYKKDAAFEAEPKPFELASVIDDVIHHHGGYGTWALEAMFGAEPVARAVVEKLVTITDVEAWDNVSHAVVSGLGVIIDRTPAATRDQLRAKLRAHHTALGENYSRATKSIDLILNGRNALEDGEGKQHAGELYWGREDPDWVEAQVLAYAPGWKGRDRNWFDAQLAFIGGPKVVAALRKSLANGGVYSEHKKAVAEQLALFP